MGGHVAGRRHADLGDAGGRLAGEPDPAWPGRARRTASVRSRQEHRRGARLRQRRSRVGSQDGQDRRTGRLDGICGPRAGRLGLPENWYKKPLPVTASAIEKQLGTRLTDEQVMWLFNCTLNVVRQTRSPRWEAAMEDEGC